MDNKELGVRVSVAVVVGVIALIISVVLRNITTEELIQQIEKCVTISKINEQKIQDQQYLNSLIFQIVSIDDEFVQALKNLSETKVHKLPVYEFNGYLYKLTPEAQSWQETRSSCQRWGGDLAVYGMKTMESRRNIMQTLTKRNMNVWIGVSDIASEGNWLWVNGEPAISSEIIWDLAAGQPNSFYPQEDCVFALGWNFKSYDSFCDLRLPYVGLCEKALQQN